MFRSMVFVASLLISISAVAQDAVPVEILERTFRIAVGNEAGTAFTMDWHGKLYLITARHVAAGSPDKGAVIKIQQQGGEWKDLQTEKTLYPFFNDVDIAVFKTGLRAPQKFVIDVIDTSNHGITLGQQVWFLGYPFEEGMGSHFNNFPHTIPFIKRGTMSAMDGTNPNAVVLYIDGFNNPGFSGGPIVFWNFLIGSRIRSLALFKVIAINPLRRSSTVKRSTHRCSSIRGFSSRTASSTPWTPSKQMRR